MYSMPLRIISLLSSNQLPERILHSHFQLDINLVPVIGVSRCKLGSQKARECNVLAAKLSLPMPRIGLRHSVNL